MAFNARAPSLLDVNLRRLQRSDLEALVAFKLHQEVDVPLEHCRAIVEAADPKWLVGFLKKDGILIGNQRVDVPMLQKARSYMLSC